MRELTSREMEQVSGGHGTGGGNVVFGMGGHGLPGSLRPLAPGTAVGRATALAHLATIQGELDALNVQEQIWSSLSHS